MLSGPNGKGTSVVKDSGIMGIVVGAMVVGCTGITPLVVGLLYLYAARQIWKGRRAWAIVATIVSSLQACGLFLLIFVAVLAMAQTALTYRGARITWEDFTGIFVLYTPVVAGAILNAALAVGLIRAVAFRAAG